VASNRASQPPADPPDTITLLWSTAPWVSCLVSADYRLAPQTRMPGIMEDIAAAMNYVRSPAFLAETHGAVDQSKVIVSGGSAGGWLALPRLRG
jgi:acetyl esterase/lipase